MSTTKRTANPAVAAVTANGEGPSPDERWELVLRIVASPQLAKSHQLRDILLYISQRSLSSSPASIKEFEIGCEVLGRGKDFNPHEDNIVRVQIGHLRRRLDEYFAAEGRNEALRLALPKGSYVPRFEPMTAAAPVHAPEIEPAVVVVEPPAVLTVVAPARRVSWLALAVAVLCAACFLAGRYLLPPPAPTVPPATPADRFWTGLFGSPMTTIVVSDSSLVMLQDVFDTDIDLEKYLSDQFPKNVLSKATDPQLRSAMEMIASRQYTSLADVNTASALVRLGQRYTSNPVQIRYSRYLNIREFKTGNFILLGARKGIPWARLFEPRLEFAMKEDPANKSYYFRNTHPQAGEPAVYRQEFDAGGKVVESYADLAVVPNLGGSGYTMLLNGLTMHATEAAGELITGPEFSQTLRSLLPASPQYFELLVRTRVIAGTAKSAEVVAWRVLEPGK